MNRTTAVFVLSALLLAVDIGKARGPDVKRIEYQRDSYGNCYAIVSGNGHWVVNVPNCP